MQIKAPFNDLQVERLNQYQDNPNCHPYTCNNSHKLIADKDGLHCWKCDYHQTWCHDFSVRQTTINYGKEQG